MKVYLVLSYEAYGDTEVEAVAASQEIAIKSAEKLAKTYSEMQRVVNTSIPSWRNNDHHLYIMEYDVLEENDE